MEYPEAIKCLTLFKQRQEKDSELYKAIETVLNEVNIAYEKLNNVSEMLRKTLDEKLELKNELFYIKNELKKTFDFEVEEKNK